MAEMSDYVAYWRRRQAKQEARNRQAAEHAWADAARIAEALVQEFGATRVILFGSLARGRFGRDSDIDLAVEGIARDEYFAAMAAANRLTRRWVDLKPLEDVEPHFRRRVFETGECLYARDVQQPGS